MDGKSSEMENEMGEGRQIISRQHMSNGYSLT